MNRHLFRHWLFALLLFLAGPLGASHPPMMAETAPEPCHDTMEMAMADGGAIHSHSEHDSTHHTAAPDHDCDSQCACCPGSCSGFVALTAQAVTPISTPNHFLSSATDAVPTRAPLELLRPPKFA
ncbi:hypothetical protein [Marinimicrobium sp. LS-A18]|uniref:hypothetical protein n=1 Tax=Marinimicrobium sp. LS-A18 TaxID=1381596 RepID=UPI0004663053|nr:hypothetical protein [Marinimicrobium sp. LS-A18]